jgi:hypothetical protein
VKDAAARIPFLFLAVAGLSLACVGQEAKPLTPEEVKKMLSEKAAMAGNDQGSKVAQQPIDPNAPKTGPRIELTSTSLDLGTISDDKEIDTKIAFKNTGIATLEISNVKGSCGCTVPALTKKTYEPGESGEIDVKYSPKGKKGVQSVNVTISSNDPLQPTLNVALKAEIKPMLSVEPPVVQFGQAGRGEAKPQTLKILNRLPDVTITQVSTSTPRVLAKVVDTKDVEVNGEKLKETTVEVSVAPDAGVGMLNESLTIRTSDSARTLNAYVSGEVLGNFMTTPQQVSFNQLSPGQPITNSFKVQSRSGKPFKITSVSATPAPGTTATSFQFAFREDTSVTPAGYVIDVTGTAPANPGAIRGDFVIATDMADEPTYNVKFFGFVRNPNPPQQPPQAQRGAWDSEPSALIPNK